MTKKGELTVELNFMPGWIGCSKCDSIMYGETKHGVTTVKCRNTDCTYYDIDFEVEIPKVKATSRGV